MITRGHNGGPQLEIEGFTPPSLGDHIENEDYGPIAKYPKLEEWVNLQVNRILLPNDTIPEIFLKAKAHTFEVVDGIIYVNFGPAEAKLILNKDGSVLFLDWEYNISYQIAA